MSSPAPMFSLREVARVFTLTESRLRYWSQTGFVNPSGRSQGRRAYTFGDLLEIKAATELLNAGIPLQRVRKNLQALRAALPDEPALLMRIRCDGETLNVSEGSNTFNPVSGQLLLDFEVDDLKKQVADILQISEWIEETNDATEAVESDNGVEPAGISPTLADSADQFGNMSAYGWFLRGCAADDRVGSEAEAIAAYEKAIDLDQSFAAAHTNLGNIHYRIGNRTTAIGHYEQACALDPDQPEAHYNLANIYDEESDPEMAIAEYRRALRLMPDFADAHFNIALALEKVGSRIQAGRHWQRYVELTPEAGATEAARAIAEKHLSQLTK